MSYILNIEALKKEFKITEVIQEYYPEWKEGKKICCPFHHEKTPSFSVSEKHNIATCFGGCGSFDPIGFVQEADSCNFVDAVEKIAQLHQLKVVYRRNLSPEQETAYRAKQNHKEALLQLNTKVTELYLSQAYPDGIAEKELFLNGSQARQLSKNTLEEFSICETPNDYNFLARQSLSMVNLLELGLIREGKTGGYFDSFKNRLLFPIHDLKGKVVGFAGRQKTEEQGIKYLNSKESPIYKKKNLLYGLFQQSKAIKAQQQLFLVEGYWDVATLYNNKFFGAVASCGTSLTKEQAQLIKKHSPRVCFLADNDASKKENSGLKAVKKALPILIKEELFVELVVLPDDQDPDSYMREQGAEAFSKYVHENRQDALLWYVEELIKERGKETFVCTQIAEEVIGILKYTKGHLADSYCQDVAKLLQLKLATFRMNYSAARQDMLDSEEGREFGDIDLTEEQTVSLRRYKVYEAGSRLKNGAHFHISNFVVEPLFYLYSRESPKRLFKITNVKGQSYLVDTDTQSLGKLERFMDLVESYGNFLFTGDKNDYNCLKTKIYDLMGSANEVNTLGTHLDGFYTFGNGIFTPEKGFIPSNKDGIVQHKGTQYFLPANSQLYKNELSSFEEEKNFQYVKPAVSFEEWAQLFCEVHGDYGKIALAYYLGAVFRSSIVKHVKFPLLNLFGMPSTGKSFLAENLLAMFQEIPTGLNLHSCTQASLSNKMTTVRDGLILLEEYKNNLPKYKIEAIKDGFDGLGREKGQKDNKRNIRNEILSALVIIGQELPTADVALFTRVLCLAFTRSEYTQEEKDKANKLKALRGSLSGITAQITTLRPIIQKQFFEKYKACSKEFQQHCEALCRDQGMTEGLSTRMIDNNALLLTVVEILQDSLKLPFSSEELFHVCADILLKQHEQFGTESEVATFWQIFEYLANDHSINSQDYKVAKKGTQELLYINFSRLYMKYTEAFQKRNGGQTALNKTSLLHYLQHHVSYIEKKGGTRFLNKNTSAYIFDLKTVGISLPTLSGLENHSILDRDKEEEAPKVIQHPTTQMLNFTT